MITLAAVALAALALAGCAPGDSDRPPGLPAPGSYIETPAGLVRLPDPAASHTGPAVGTDPRCRPVPNPIPGDTRAAWVCDGAGDA